MRYLQGSLHRTSKHHWQSGIVSKTGKQETPNTVQIRSLVIEMFDATGKHKAPSTMIDGWFGRASTRPHHIDRRVVRTWQPAPTTLIDGWSDGQAQPHHRHIIHPLPLLFTRERSLRPLPNSHIVIGMILNRSRGAIGNAHHAEIGRHFVGEQIAAKRRSLNHAVKVEYLPICIGCGPLEPILVEREQAPGSCSLIALIVAESNWAEAGSKP